jgi:hypothetical protein
VGTNEKPDGDKKTSQALARESTPSILGRLFHMVEDKDLARTRLRLQFEPKLLFEGLLKRRKLAVRLYWMLLLHVDYAQLIQGSHAGQPGTFCGRG